MTGTIPYNCARASRVPSLILRTAAGEPVERRPSLDLYCWSSRPGMLRDIRDARDEIEAIKPDRVILHGNPSEIAAEGAAAILIAQEIMGPLSLVPAVGVGIGADGWADEWRRGAATSEQVIRPLVRAVKIAYDAGARLMVPNLEAAWKRHNNADGAKDVRTEEELAALVEAVARAMMAVAPDAVFMLSSYDQPTLHRSMKLVYRILTRLFPAVTGQTYVAVPGIPSRMALPSRLAAFAASFDRAEEEGWVTRDEIEREIAEDCDRIPTLQGHKTHPNALTKALVEEPQVILWSAPMIVDEGRREDGRLDSIGFECARFACDLRAHGWVGPGAIAALQRALGFTDGDVDGVPGLKLWAACGYGDRYRLHTAD